MKFADHRPVPPNPCDAASAARRRVTIRSANQTNSNTTSQSYWSIVRRRNARRRARSNPDGRETGCDHWSTRVTPDKEVCQDATP
ncbi:hypothetical protein [Azospirillum melinis]